MIETIESMPTRTDQLQFAQALVEQARSEGVELIGPGGLLTGLTKTVLETAREAEITDHLGYDQHDQIGPQRRQLPQRHTLQDRAHRDRPGPDRGAGDRDGTFEPGIVCKRQRRLDGGSDHSVALGARVDDRRDCRAFRRGLRRDGQQRQQKLVTRVPGHP